MAKASRGKKSKIDRLPQDIKDRLNELLRGGMSQKAILDEVNALCEACGEAPLSQAGVSRYASRMESVGARVRESREVAEVWTAKLGNAPTTDVGKLLQEFIRTLAFDLTMDAMESGKPVEPKALNQMALAMARIEQAAMTSHKREKEIRKAFADEAAANVEASLANQGMTAST
ncbi:hypothetical protein ACH42_08405, partial [Endozoicomonas sp. (ex Bugula neritina AB1)]